MRKKYDPLRSLRKAAVGIRVSWSDETPMEESDHIVDGAVTHNNPMLRPMATKLWASDFGKRMTNSIAARWRVTITGIFRYANGVDQEETRELEAHCVLSRINDVALEQVQDIMRHGGGKYVTTRFEVECLGL